MHRRSFTIALLGTLGLGALGAACGLDFGDIANSTPAGSATTSATIPGQPPPPPTGTTVLPGSDANAADATVGADASLPNGLDGGSNLDAGDARPPPTNVAARVVFRFEWNGICGFDGLTPVYCTRNEGTFGAQGKYRGASAQILGTPGGAPYGTTGVNAWRADIGNGPSTNAIDIDNAIDVIPVGTAPTMLTVAAWVKRSETPRENARIVSLGPVTGGQPIFELGFRRDSETKVLFSVDEALDRGRDSAQPSLLTKDEWTFVAATYDSSLSNNHLCFYRGTESLTVALVNCTGYPNRDIKRTASRFSVGNVANDSDRGAAKKVSFPGGIDNVFVYVGAALDLAELTKLQRD